MFLDMLGFVPVLGLAFLCGPFGLGCPPYLDLAITCPLLLLVAHLLRPPLLLQSYSLVPLLPEVTQFLPFFQACALSSPSSLDCWMCNLNPQLLVSPNTRVQSCLHAELCQRNHTRAVIKKMSISPL